MFMDSPVFKILTLFFRERSRNESVDLMADLGYDIMAIVDTGVLMSAFVSNAKVIIPKKKLLICRDAKDNM